MSFDLFSDGEHLLLRVKKCPCPCGTYLWILVTDDATDPSRRMPEFDLELPPTDVEWFDESRLGLEEPSVIIHCGKMLGWLDLEGVRHVGRLRPEAALKFRTFWANMLDEVLGPYKPN